jgi:hypothetical protein
VGMPGHGMRLSPSASAIQRYDGVPRTINLLFTAQ